MQCPKEFYEVISEQTIHNELTKMAQDLDDLYEKSPFRFIVLLDGAVPFTQKLLSLMTHRPESYEMRASSYYGGETSSGVVTLQADWEEMDLSMPIVILDDVLDTGRTLHEMKRQLLKHGAPDVFIAVAISKTGTRVVEVEADWEAFRIGPEFLIGFGMDLDGKYRDLPYIAQKR